MIVSPSLKKVNVAKQLSADKWEERSARRWAGVTEKVDQPWDRRGREEERHSREEKRQRMKRQRGRAHHCAQSSQFHREWMDGWTDGWMDGWTHSIDFALFCFLSPLSPRPFVTPLFLCSFHSFIRLFICCSSIRTPSLNPAPSTSSSPLSQTDRPLGIRLSY